jgi:hypothetical protein
MLKIHPDATPLIIEDNKQVGWQLITNDFEFHAICQIGLDGKPAETVSSYVNWGDDQGADVVEHESMDDAKRWLDTLLQASRR